MFKPVTTGQLLAVLSFVLETALIYLILFHFNPDHLLLFGILNGLFNCSYWMLQRVLFSTISSADNSGAQFRQLSNHYGAQPESEDPGGGIFGHEPTGDYCFAFPDNQPLVLLHHPH